MNLEKLFELQNKLNQRIRAEHKLKDENLIQEQILALEVELGELANETRCFKYWSHKPPAPQSVILEEYVDGLHFILSLGLEMNFNNSGLNLVTTLENENNLIQQFQLVYDQITEFNHSKSFESYENLFVDFLQLGRKLGFEEVEVEQAYLDKNKVNHKRQDEGY